MFKVMALLKRRADISLEQFKTHYDERHVPLAFAVFPTIKAHRRNYRLTLPRQEPDSEYMTEYDCVTEIWYEARAGFEAMMAALAEPSVAALIIADEERFLDRSKSVLYMVEESAMATR